MVVVQLVALEVKSEVIVVVGVGIERHPQTVEATLDWSDLMISTPLFLVARASKLRF